LSITDRLKSFGEISRLFAETAHEQGLIKDPNIVISVSGNESNTLTPYAATLWDTNARLRASRARKLLGWKPIKTCLADDIADIIECEALGLEMAGTSDPPTG
jgi:hypothetical protein